MAIEVPFQAIWVGIDKFAWNLKCGQHRVKGCHDPSSRAGTDGCDCSTSRSRSLLHRGSMHDSSGALSPECLQPFEFHDASLKLRCNHKEALAEIGDMSPSSGQGPEFQV